MIYSTRASCSPNNTAVYAGLTPNVMLLCVAMAREKAIKCGLVLMVPRREGPQNHLVNATVWTCRSCHKNNSSAAVNGKHCKSHYGITWRRKPTRLSQQRHRCGLLLSLLQHMLHKLSVWCNGLVQTPIRWCVSFNSTVQTMLFRLQLGL